MAVPPLPVAREILLQFVNSTQLGSKLCTAADRVPKKEAAAVLSAGKRITVALAVKAAQQCLQALEDVEVKLRFVKPGQESEEVLLR